MYEKLKNVFIDLGISREEAARIIIVNAYRLPRKSRDTDGAAAGDQGPDPIIAKFAIMRDRQRILEAYDNQSRNKNAAADHVTSRGATAGTSSRISVRTDLLPTMKFRRGKLANTAYNLRKEKKNLSTKIFVIGTDVIVQFKEKKRQRLENLHRQAHRHGHGHYD